jgi:hypothetical protein
MATTKKRDTEPDEPEVYEQAEDDRGRTRLDRRLTTAEARAQDEENRERYLEGRRRRFEGRVAE